MYSAMLGSGNDADLVERTVGKIVKELSIIYIYIYIYMMYPSPGTGPDFQPRGAKV